MNEEIEGALTIIGFMKNHYEYEKNHDHTINYDFFHKTLVENMNILDKNNYEYPEDEKKLLEELKSIFFSKCSEDYKNMLSKEDDETLSLR